MPIYEFECTCCPSRFELKRSFHDENPVSCPQCGGKARRRFSSVPIIFKGSGFYVTDSKGSQSFTSTADTSGDGKSEAQETKTATPVESKAGVADSKPAKSEAKAGKKAEAKVGSGKEA